MFDDGQANATARSGNAVHEQREGANPMVVKHDMTVDRIVTTLSMRPHPEGGWYAETLRDHDLATSNVYSTAIYYLLAKGQRSNWHRLKNAAEVWHYYMGSPLEMTTWHDGSGITRLTLGIELENMQRPQLIVPKGYWQSAATTGNFTLVGCTVSPGFNFADFELAPPGWEPETLTKA